MSYSEWEIRKLVEIGEIITGKTPATKKEENFGDKAYFITPRDMVNQKKITFTERRLSQLGIDSVKKQFIKGPAICVSCIGSDMGKVMICNENFITNQQINTLANIRKNYDIDFLYYSLKPMKEYLHNIAGGSTMPIVNKSTFENIEIKLPPLEEQKAIAKILSDLDEKIEINNKINKNLEEMAGVIFKRWFVDFEFPNEEGKPYKTSGGEMVESELGMIPKGWEIKSLEEVCLKITDGSHFSPKNSNKGIYPMLSVKDMRNYGFEYSECKKIKKDDYQKMINTDCVPKRNDILVAKDGSYLKHIFIVNEEKENAILSSIAIFRADNSKIYPEILLNILKNPILQKKVKENFVSGSALPRIVLKDFKRLKIIIATIELQSQIQKKLKKYNEKIYNNILENAKLENLRDILLPKLMSGEVRVL